jgi:hypothetical protein
MNSIGQNGRKSSLFSKINYDYELKRDSSPGPCAYQHDVQRLMASANTTKTPIYKLPVKRIKPAVKFD